METKNYLTASGVKVWIFDNRGKTLDKYTVIDEHGGVYTMSHNACSPQGVCMFSYEESNVSGFLKNERISGRDEIKSWNDVPEDVKTATENYMDGYKKESAWVCKKCGSENVEVRGWYNLQTKETTPLDETPIDENTWCCECEDHTGIEWK